MRRTKSQDDVKEAVETQVIAAMQKQGYSMNTVNNYDENLLHVSAANDCFRIVKEILNQKENCHVIDRKNKFGWTPLMQAIRNGNIDTVKLLLEKDIEVDKVTYLGMSVLGLAAAINKEMFETVYNACPDALVNAANDDITPLCIAAMKNDKELFFRLLELGMPLSTDNEYTRLMMKYSTIPEIAALVNADSAMDDYWNDTSDNIQVIEQNIDDTTKDSKPISKNKNKKHKNKLHLSISTEFDKQDLISPNLTYDIFVLSPNAVCFEKNDLIKKSDVVFQNKDESKKTMEKDYTTSEFESPSVIFKRNTNSSRFQSARPTDFDTKNFSCDLNITLGFTPEFSPLKSPHVPPDVNEENVFGENTPTPPRCKTPPKGMLLNWSETKMIMILRRFGLSQHIPIFLEQEVDIDLFLTLTDNDLIEIGIEFERDRHALLEAIKECKNRKTY
ncbi:Ankyrin repeat and SAM domain-containing protein 6 [Formica fusca]